MQILPNGETFRLFMRKKLLKPSVLTARTCFFHAFMENYCTTIQLHGKAFTSLITFVSHFVTFFPYFTCRLSDIQLILHSGVALILKAS